MSTSDSSSAGLLASLPGFITAGLTAAIVGFASSAVLVFQAAAAMGADPSHYGSWIWASATGMGLLSVLLSLRYRIPVVVAWSTPGAALLAASVGTVAVGDAIGAFIISALAIIVFGISGGFERIMNRLPQEIAGALLAGVLVRFGMDIFTAMQSQLLMAGAMFLMFLAARRFAPRYAIVLVLLTGAGLAWWQGAIDAGSLRLELVSPRWVMPTFSWQAVIGIGIPLFCVTMASQNVPGVAVIRASGYGTTPISPLITATGLVTLLLAPFGAFALNLSALIAAICMGREAHPDPDRRYGAAVAYGLISIAVGLLGATVAGLFAILPTEFVAALAGLALLGPIGAGLAAAMQPGSRRDAALITFLVAASGVSVAGVGSAFWALVAALLVLAFDSGTSASPTRT